MPISKLIVLVAVCVAAHASALEAPPQVQACIACHGANGEGTLGPGNEVELED